MGRVTGIGGLFFRAERPEELSAWYERHLGVPAPPATYDVSSWWQQAGPTVFAPMSADSAHVGRDRKGWAVNFRVADLDLMVAQLRAAGVDVEIDPEVYPNGRFAALRDPEGNVVELWEPDGADRVGAPNRG